ncbi:putative isoAsp protein carboxyl methyltransferase [Paratrimastix pyriformis]|uniref:protein-L-isoaspartate(D-aspartate) O-methyltransferase n=1 Tax=Paratrimastix pyriformis TaxID=342808 RepID=A0ABQ8UQT3_9EUKA|nr:putative isoAsp protein carboxyl methyltransferase [Paratrimastix pyriformis]
MAYADMPLPIGAGATISAPHMHAIMLDLAASRIQSGSHVLDVGSGSGYCTAVFAEMLRAAPGGAGRGKVYGIDHVAPLVEQSRANIRGHDPTMLESGLVELIVGDGRRGYHPGAPYQVIHVGAMVEDIIPQPFLEQLAPGGRLIVPVQGMLMTIDNTAEPTNEPAPSTEQLFAHTNALGVPTVAFPTHRFYTESHMGVAFVPLTDLAEQTSGRTRPTRILWMGF